MGPLVWTSLVTFAASLCLTVTVRAAARRRNIVDRPDGKRKLHERPVPLLGGVAVYGAAVLGLLAVQCTAGATVKFNELSIAWIIAAGFVCFVGSIDDCFNLPSRIKLGLQIVSVLPIVFLGYYVDRIVAFGYPIALGWIGMPLTVVWLVGCINALNLIDGMDGLASIVGLSTAAMLGVIAASQGQDHVALMALVLTGSLAGFLIYNLPPASIFLGDSGSMVIGLTIGVLGIQGSLKTSATLAITAPAVVMTLPMFDIAAALVRRRLTGRRFDSPDRLHIHHRLLDRGWTPWQVLWLIGAICLTMGAAATAATICRLDALAWIAAMSLIVLMIRLRLFGHDEFSLAKHAAVRTIRSVLGLVAQFARRVKVYTFGNGVQEWNAAGQQLTVPEPESRQPDSWDRLLRSLRGWNVRQVEFTSSRGATQRRIRWINPAAAEEFFRWSLAVSLPGGDGNVYELRTTGAEEFPPKQEADRLIALLKTFGAQLAANPEQLFGRPLPIERPAVVETPPEPRRKAA
jgi:UDP-GlcNAc:undecaprenyl-phosphate/decaprenyl-phosphate GlcNAc-1-phosphate transferase